MQEFLRLDGQGRPFTAHQNIFVTARFSCKPASKASFWFASANSS